MNRAITQLAYASIVVGGITYYLFNFQSGLLGPYGFSSDVYHELILFGLIMMVFLLFQIYAYTVLRRRNG